MKIKDRVAKLERLESCPGRRVAIVTAGPDGTVHEPADFTDDDLLIVLVGGKPGAGGAYDAAA